MRLLSEVRHADPILSASDRVRDLAHLKHKYATQPEYRKKVADYKKENIARVRFTNKRWRENNLERTRELARNGAKTPHMRVLRKALDNKRRCQMMGNGGMYTPEQWTALCALYGNRCVCCGRKVKLTVDHVIAVVNGGSNNIENIQPLCLSCNSRKHCSNTDYRDSPHPDCVSSGLPVSSGSADGCR